MSKRAISIEEVKWLLAQLKPELRTFCLGLISLFIGAALNLLIPELIRRVLSPDNLSFFLSYPIYICLIFAAIFTTQGISFFFRIKLFTAVGLRVVNRVKQQLFDKLLSLPPLQFENQKSGDLVSRLTLDTSTIQDVISVKLSVLIRYSLQVVIGIILMLFFSPLLSGVLLISLVFLVLISIFLGKHLKKLSKETQEGNAEVSALASEVFADFRAVKAFSIEKFIQDKFVVLLNSALSSAYRRAQLSAFFQSFVSSLMNFAILIVVVLGIWLTNQGQLSIGELSAFLLYGVIVAVSFAFVSSGYSELAQAFGSISRVREILTDSKPSSSKDFSIDYFEDLVFKDVTFSYPKRAEQLILNKLNFTIKKGENVALVGASGSGKSTIAALILGLFHPNSGEILINQCNIKHLSSQSISKIFSYVPQEPKLFSFSLRENLIFSKDTSRDAEIEHLLKELRIFDFVAALSKGLDTECGERGLDISAGQRQRLAIARALLKKSQFIIFDEATSALDSVNESSVITTLKEHYPDLTSLVIAHRDSTIKSCDRVLSI